MAQQLLLKGVDGTTRCLHFGSGERVSCWEIKTKVYEIEGIPCAFQRVVTGTKQLEDEDVLQPMDDGLLPNCSILLRLRGGKGGFGSLLRGAATGGRHKKISNFDACRDINGRRLRHVNAEKKLIEWKAEAGLRELEKKAEEYLKKESRQKKNENAIAEDIQKFREQTEKNMEEVEAAVLDGLSRSKKLGTDGKRKKIETVVAESKRLRLALEEGSDDEDDDDLFSEPLFGSSSGASSSGSQSQEEEMEADEENCRADKEVLDKVEPPEAKMHEADVVVPQVVEEAEPAPTSVGKAKPEATPAKVDAPKEVEAQKSDSVAKAEKQEVHVPLNLEEFSSAKELESVGLERLKQELQHRGLKCGGSLPERAARLYLLKTTPIEKLDKKLFAKSR